MATRSVTISTPAAAVLSKATIAGDLVTLPPGRLPKDLYADVDKVLRALGGKWDRRRGGHVFPEDAEPRLTVALASGAAIDTKRSAEQFFTPPALAARVVELAGLAGGEHILEPSAGEGALIDEPLRRGCFVTAVEQDRQLADRLGHRIHGFHAGGVWCADFLEWRTVARAPIDVVLMNPPFSRGQDMRHVVRAYDFLRPGGRLVAIMSPHHRFAVSRQAQAFRAWLSMLDHDVEDVAGGAFRAAGTDIATLIITIRKEPA